MRRRSGIAAAVIGVIVIVIIVVAAVAAYAVLANQKTTSSTTTSTGSSQATTSSSSSISATSAASSLTTTSSVASVNTTCLSSSSGLTSDLANLTATVSPQGVLNLLGTYSSMAVEINETTSGIANSSSPISFVSSYSYDTIYASATTYKVNATIAEASIANLTETFWILRDGSLLAAYVAESESGGSSIPGTNLTGSFGQSLVGSTFAIFQQEAHPANLTAYTNPAMYHVSATSTEDIGKILMSVSTYVANNLPETLNECGVPIEVSADTVQLGTPQGGNSSLVVYEHVVTSDVINGTTIASDLDLQLTTIAVATAPPSSSGVWTYGNPYPAQVDGIFGVSDQTCVNQTDDIICVGGFGNNGTAVDDVYSAPVTSSGMGGWTSQTAYPIAAGLVWCLSYSGYVYCIGGQTGNDANPNTTAAAYYAPLTSAGVGNWQSTTSYPVPIAGESCAASSGYIYCVAGLNATDGTAATIVASDSAWFAPISSSGIGAWQKTTAYPSGIEFPVCTPTATTLYCFGGLNSNYTGVDDVYYATFGSSGLGQWKSTTPYPQPLQGEQCIVDSGDIICLGGSPSGNGSASQAVYYAPITASGLGSWHQGQNYPVPINTFCVFAAGNIYCVGGLSNPNDYYSDFVFFASVESILG